MKITTKRLVLRDLGKNDLESLVENINNLNVSRYLAVAPYPYHKKDGDMFIRKCKSRARQKPRINYNFGIAFKKENKIIGMISIVGIDRYKGTAEIGYWLGEKYWRQGIMTEAAEKVIDYAFKTLKLRRINISAFKENEASKALIRKMGFRYEGLRRKEARSKATGKIYDQCEYGMLRSEWK